MKEVGKIINKTQMFYSLLAVLFYGHSLFCELKLPLKKSRERFMKLDIHGNNITQKRIRQSMNLSIIAGALGMPWFILCTPQQILTVYVSNYLDATSLQLGLLVAGINLASLFHLASVYFYNRSKRIKYFWIITTLMQRILAFVLAWVGLYMARGGNALTGIYIILICSILSASLGNLSSSGWWAWMAQLVPERYRATFFGKRSAITQAVNVLFFFGATYILDLYASRAFYIFALMYFIAGIGGTVDILLHLGIPEPAAQKKEPQSRKKDFIAPLKDPGFLRFCIMLGIFLFSQNIAAPFLAPYTTDSEGIGAPNIWLGIMVVISQGIWVLIVPLWGIIMDRMGKNSVVVIGGLFVFSWIGYFFLTPHNYTWLLPLIAFIGGILAPGFWEGISQMMLNLTKEDNRTSYIAWYWTFFGVSAAMGSFTGGWLDDFFTAHPLSMGQIEIRPIYMVILLSLLMVVFSLTHLSRLRMPGEKSLTMVLSTVINPGIFRAVSGMGLLSRPAPSMKIKKVLRNIDGKSSSLAVSEVIMRLEDPDSEVREEAAKALGRIGSEEAEAALLDQLKDPDSSIQPSVAKALGEMGSKKAVPHLLHALESASDDLQQAALTSLGNIDTPESSQSILSQLRGDKPDHFKAHAAMAASQRKVLEAAEDIFRLMHEAKNKLLRKQMSIAVANLLGEPGEFYRYVSGDSEQREKASLALINETSRLLQLAAKGKGADKRLQKQLSGDMTRMKQAMQDGQIEDFLPFMVDLQSQLDQWFNLNGKKMPMSRWLLERLSSIEDFQRCPDLDMILAIYGIRCSLSNELTKIATKKN